jgi:hypothetical protein
MLRSYARLVLFSFGLLVGMQIPNFVDQYAKRVAAHQIEAEKNFRGFQETADRYFNGDVDALIAHHASSADRVFHDEARTIAELYARVKMWRAEWAALQPNFAVRVFHVALRANAEIRDETIDAYTYEIPLTPAAIGCGLSVGLILALVVEALGVGMLRLFGLGRPVPVR